MNAARPSCCFASPPPSSSPARRRAPSHGRSRRFRSTSASTTRWGSPAPCTASLRLSGISAISSGPPSCSPQNEEANAADLLWTLSERLEHEIGFRMVAAERVRYERNLTPPLTSTNEYRAGIADAANIDPLTAAAEIVNP